MDLGAVLRNPRLDRRTPVGGRKFRLELWQPRPPCSWAGCSPWACQTIAITAAVARPQALAVARVGGSRACPFDLHALVPVPVPVAVLRLGPDDPAALAWLWQHWGTMQTLREVAEDTGAASRGGPAPGEAMLAISFWSADRTPWRAVAAIAATWKAPRFDTGPNCDAP
jgi:hypothetical protein